MEKIAWTSVGVLTGYYLVGKLSRLLVYLSFLGFFVLGGAAGYLAAVHNIF
jgi:hypothetical protein